MGLLIKNDRVTPEIGAQLTSLCPFGALEYLNGKLEVNAGCKNCKLCIKKGPAGIITWEEPESFNEVNKQDWHGIAVYAEIRSNKLHPVALELIGKALELAMVNKHPVYVLLIGNRTEQIAEELQHYGVDSIYVYDNPCFENFDITPYANVFFDFIQKVKPSSILVGATNLGRSLAPKVAARCNTGLTADCTRLEMRENTDLVQIRPAFGGNIMAQIVTPQTRPQFCTVRYKIFSAPERKAELHGTVCRMSISESMLKSQTKILSIKPKKEEKDISDADVIIACGRGVRNENDIELVKQLANLMHAQIACTRPLIENGWMDSRHQIGLSGRTVKPKLIITIGVSGSVQFSAGMRGSSCIVAINDDPAASIFNIAHIGIVGDLYDVLPKLIEKIRGEIENV